MRVTVAEALDILDEDDSWRRFQVDYPEAKLGPYSIEKFSIDRNDKTRIRWIQDEGLDRDPGHGTFRKLVETMPGDEGPGRRLWMSDTRAEILEHKPVFDRLSQTEGTRHKRVLINGLGLGVVVHGALTFDGIDHIDVVERDPDIISLIGHFVENPRVTIHLSDAYEIKWPPGSRWDIVWHDIWPAISDENVPEMDRLLAKYRGRAAWQGCWQRKGCLAMAKAFRDMDNGNLPYWRALEMLGGKAPWLP